MNWHPGRSIFQFDFFVSEFELFPTTKLWLYLILKWQLTEIFELFEVFDVKYLDGEYNNIYVLGHKYVLGPKHIYAQEHKLYYY